MRTPRTRPEVWGGVECTVNRVGDRYGDQLARSGHLTRVRDIGRFAELGMTTLRMPVLWEHARPTADGSARFDHIAPLLEAARAAGIRVIAGLCHHGSGPPFTHLLDPSFEHALARYAEEVARAFPWIDGYTPINEPVTTARFSALYGHWYPHARDTGSFLRALLHECRATIRAMAAIRRVQPSATLVQTEDLPTVRSTAPLAYQAEYENDRRFLGFDFLAGRVRPGHPLYDHVLAHGIEQRELEWLAEHACMPDLIGINYYVTSDRYLDHRLELYPASRHGGNGRDRYVDADAVRVPGVGIAGHAAILEAVHHRYRRPVALTEVHLGCTREEQLRWLGDAWDGACEALRRGVDVRALTAWALLGSFDWNSLVCVDAGVYECGAFDLRCDGEPRPTALASMLRALARDGSHDHPALAGRGWWRQDTKTPAAACAPVLIAGDLGPLATEVSRACTLRGLPHHRFEEGIAAHPGQLDRVLRELRAWAVVHACERPNRMRARTLAEACARSGVPLLSFTPSLCGAGPNALLIRTEAPEPERLPAVVHASLDLLIDAERGGWRVHDRPNDVRLVRER